ncbi:substrate-binding domain-containing protein [Acidisoma cellulosilytica]|uniref:Substrate-binding domain-containing protein n=1 Tax=Acidisoma cellulosilyticum TaxID=2802395 RepID=A0A963Z1V9_9PROT|nr:substrate-binding domain-containing protein [Acidisoma cellulosilyticum]MCB8881091.1 substrate-binding domain-containing protein [Acidisoma cellulosilyticum]
MSDAQTTLRIFSGLAVRAAFDDGLLDAFERSGIAVDVAWNPTTVIEAKIARGETADLIIATTGSIQKLVDKGVVDGDSCQPLVDACLGVAVAQGAPKPRIGSTVEFFSALKNARSVAWSLGGQSGIYLETLLAGQGLLDEVKARASTIPEGFTAEQIVKGDADLAIQQVSELMVVKGVDIVGPFPEELQTWTPFRIGIFTQSANKEAAEAFIAFLQGAEAQDSFLRNGVRLAA